MEFSKIKQTVEEEHGVGWVSFVMIFVNEKYLWFLRVFAFKTGNRQAKY